MDALIVAGIAHLGENTNHQKSVKILLKDKRIEALSSGGVRRNLFYVCVMLKKE